MIFVEYLLIIMLLATITGTISLVVNRYFAKLKAKDFVSQALQSGSRKRIEDSLILYGDQLDKNTKEALKLRVDELLIEEDDENLERKINEL